MITLCENGYTRQELSLNLLVSHPFNRSDQDKVRDIHTSIDGTLDTKHHWQLMYQWKIYQVIMLINILIAQYLIYTSRKSPQK